MPLILLPGIPRTAALAALAVFAAAFAQAPQTAARPREPLTVMSFNIRYGTANDGENHWKQRREFLFDVVREAELTIDAETPLEWSLRFLERDPVI